jgi:secreted trypsin-like serine protease
MKRLAAAVGVVLSLLVAGPTSAIVFGQLDGDAHPSVGAFVAPVGEEDALVPICTGTLIAPTVFLTAAHCTAFLVAVGIDPDDVFVTFDSAYTDTSTLIAGEYVHNPDFGGPLSDPHDVAVVLLDSPPAGVTPSRLPIAGLLDSLDLKSERFITVGYGTVREDKTKGPHSLFGDGQRRWAEQGFRSLTGSWLNLSMNPSIGSGGTCYGDSGGPHFLGTSNVIASITVTGDRWCRSTDVTYRMDTESARAFLGDYVTLP